MKTTISLITLTLSLPVFSQIYADIAVDIPSSSGGSTTGNIRVELDYVNAPKTVANFITLAEGSRPWIESTTGEVKSNTPYYDGIIFHRVISGFVLQAGSQKGDGSDGPGYNFPDEVGNGLLHDAPYKLSMANSGPNTNGSQFFITLAATPWLDGIHTVFGEVTTGSSNVDLIEGVTTGANDKPDNDVTITSVTIDRIGAAAISFDEFSQNLPTITSFCPKMSPPAGTDGASLEVNQVAGSTINLGLSENLTTWNIEKRHLSFGESVENNYVTSLSTPKGFCRPAIVNWATEANFPSNLTGKTITFTIGADVIVIDYDNQTTVFNGEPPGSLDDTLTYTSDGYGANIFFNSSNLIPIRLRMGADVPQAPDHAGRISGTGFGGSTGSFSITGTFTIN